MPDYSEAALKKALAEALAEFPQLLKRKEAAAKHRAKVLKAFAEAEKDIFPMGVENYFRVPKK